MRTPLWLTFAVLLLTSCGNGDGATQAQPSPCPPVVPAADTSEVPEALRLERHATVTEVMRRRGALGVTAVSDLPVVELYPPLARAVLDAGYSIVSSDNEGFEAEIFFGDDSVTGAYRLREAECPDRVIVRLLFEERGAK